MPRRRAATKIKHEKIKKTPMPAQSSVALAEQLMLASFACTCGVEIDIGPHATVTTEIVCVACGEWHGVYAELLPAPIVAKKRAKISRPSPDRSSARGSRSRGRDRSRY